MALPHPVRVNRCQDVVYKRVVRDFGATDPVSQSIVPFTELVHDRLSIEILRGCARGCRFCQAGITYRPVRERTPEPDRRCRVARPSRDGIRRGLAHLAVHNGSFLLLRDPASSEPRSRGYRCICLNPLAAPRCLRRRHGTRGGGGEEGRPHLRAGSGQPAPAQHHQ